MNKDIKGQSIIEFAISVTVLIVFLAAIPILAKIANANIMSIQALDYAAWRVREGNTDNNKLTQEVSDRYFGETALIVDDEKINNQGANLGVGRNGELIYQPNSVDVVYVGDNSSDYLRHIDNHYRFGLFEKKGTVSISLPLQNLAVIPEIENNLIINKSLYVENQTLAARDKLEIQEKMNQFDSATIPYNSNFLFGQQSRNRVINNLVITPINQTLGRISRVFRHHRLDDPKVDHDEVPRDRLVQFQP